MREPGWREWPVAARVHAAKQRRRGERGRQMRNVYTYMKTTNTQNNGVSNRYVYVPTHVYRQAGAFSTWAVRLCARTYSYISWAHPTLGITARCSFSFSPSLRLVPALPLPPTLPHPPHTIFSPFLSLDPVPYARCLVLSVFPRRSIFLSVAQGRSSSLHVDESQIAAGRQWTRVKSSGSDQTNAKGSSAFLPRL